MHGQSLLAGAGCAPGALDALLALPDGRTLALLRLWQDPLLAGDEKPHRHALLDRSGPRRCPPALLLLPGNA